VLGLFQNVRVPKKKKEKKKKRKSSLKTDKETLRSTRTSSSYDMRAKGKRKRQTGGERRERKRKKEKRKEEKGKERKGKERKGKQRKGTKRKEKERKKKPIRFLCQRFTGNNSQNSRRKNDECCAAMLKYTHTCRKAAPGFCGVRHKEGSAYFLLVL